MRRPVLAVCLTILLGSACSAPPPPQRDPFGTTLAAAVSSAYTARAPVRLDAVTPFDWDRFFAFKPQTSPAEIDRALGFTWAKNYSDQTDTYCLLVFVKSGAVARSLLYPRYQGDCTTLGKAGPFARVQAVFRVTSSGKTTGGQPFLQLHEAP
jgi:hypothetical protein